MSRHQQTTISEFYCTKCGKKGMPLARKRAKLRQGEHLKKLFCIYCQEEINHLEIRESDMFHKEELLERLKNGEFYEPEVKDNE